METNPLKIKSIDGKIALTQELLSSYHDDTFKDFTVPNKPERDVEALPPKQHPKKRGLSFVEGRIRLLHDLTSIELQAMELGLRTLIEFQNKKDVHFKFLKELAEITYEESEHCKLCLKLLRDLGGEWGEIPIHLGLWNVSRPQDDLLERLLRVHRYLEGSGLDATFNMANRLKDIKGAEKTHALILRIANDELRHVQFGSRWFDYFCTQKKVSRITECKRILKNSIGILPYRREAIRDDLRESAGFLSEEVQAFKDFQKELCI